MAEAVMLTILQALLAATLIVPATSALGADDNPFVKHGKLRISKSGTYLEHADGAPFFFLADTVWTGPALSTEADWKLYLADRKKKGFTAIQFNCVSPWRTAPTDREGRTSYSIKDGKLVPNEAFFQQLDARLKAINDVGLLAVPVLAWAHKKGDAGFDLAEEQVITLVEAHRPRRLQGPPRLARHHAPDRHELPLERLGGRKVAHRAWLPERPRRRRQHGEVDPLWARRGIRQAAAIHPADH
jgi:hypothetical protein